MKNNDSLQQSISSLLNPKSKVTIHLIPQSHIDLAWLWTWSETLNKICNTLEGHVSILMDKPEVTYAQSQVQIYWTCENLFPHLFERIRRLVVEGRWEIVGGEWVEADHLLPSGESLVRQFLAGQTYLKNKFGRLAEVGWTPDAFGHSPNFPQVMLKSGLKSFIFKRPREKFLNLPEVPFWWVGLDGSRILSLRVNNKGKGLPRVSEGRVLPENTHEITYLQDQFAKFGIHHLWGTLGVGNGGGVNIFPEVISEKNWRMIYSTPSLFVEEVKKEMSGILEIKGELSGTFKGAYTTHIDMKEGNRRAESQIFITEFLASLAMIFGQLYPDKEIKEILHRFLFNHFHDIIAGTSIPEVHIESRQDYGIVVRKCKELQRKSLLFLTEKIDTSGLGKPLVVFNPLNWERTDLVKVEIDANDDVEALEIVDVDGSTRPVQILKAENFQRPGRQLILFVASKVPPLGYKVMRLRPAQKKKSNTVYENTAENEFFRIVGDPKTGYLESVFDKRLNREILKSGKVAARWLVFEEGCYVQDYNKDLRAWNLGLTGRIYEATKTTIPTLLNEGPVRSTLVLRHRFGNSSFEQYVHIYHGIPRIDVTVRMWWEEVEKLARLEFPIDIEAGKIVAEVPFGAIPRPANGTEFPAHRWVDISGEGWGMALLNDSRYGHSVQDNHIRISVIRCSTQPDSRSDHGEYKFRYALYPHSGSWIDANIHRRGCEFNVPLVGVEATLHEGNLPSLFSLVSFESPQLIASALKKAEEGNELILRFYEAIGSRTTTRMRFDSRFKKIKLEETNLIEDSFLTHNPVNEEYEIECSPFEIKTLRISFDFS